MIPLKSNPFPCSYLNNKICTTPFFSVLCCVQLSSKLCPAGLEKTGFSQSNASQTHLPINFLKPAEIKQFYLQLRRPGHNSTYQVLWLIPHQRGKRIRGNLCVRSWSNETKVMLIGLIYCSSKSWLSLLKCWRINWRSFIAGRNWSDFGKCKSQGDWRDSRCSVVQGRMADLWVLRDTCWQTHIGGQCETIFVGPLPTLGLPTYKNEQRRQIQG